MRELSDSELESVVGGLAKEQPAQAKTPTKTERRATMVASVTPIATPKATGGCSGGVCRPA